MVGELTTRHPVIQANSLIFSHNATSTHAMFSECFRILLIGGTDRNLYNYALVTRGICPASRLAACNPITFLKLALYPPVACTTGKYLHSECAQQAKRRAHKRSSRAQQRL